MVHWRYVGARSANALPTAAAAPITPAAASTISAMTNLFKERNNIFSILKISLYINTTVLHKYKSLIHIADHVTGNSGKTYVNYITVIRRH